MPRRRVGPTSRGGRGWRTDPPDPPRVDRLDLGPAVEELARVGRVITYDRRGYARSGGEPVRNLSTHSADAAALLESLQAPPAVVVGTSSGAMIALDLAVRRPDLVRAVVEYEGPWRFTRHPDGFAGQDVRDHGVLVLRGRHSDAPQRSCCARPTPTARGNRVERLPGGVATGRQGEREGDPVGLLISIGNHPSAAELASIDVPVVCSYGSRSPDFMARRTQSLAAAIPTARIHRIEGAAHAAPFDAPANFAQLIADTVTVRDGDALSRR